MSFFSGFKAIRSWFGGEDSPQKAPIADHGQRYLQINESRINLRAYDGELRQIIVRGNGHETPAFLITNDFQDRDAPKLYRHFVKGKGVVLANGGIINVTYTKRAYNPILRGAPRHNLPNQISGLEGTTLNLKQ